MLEERVAQLEERFGDIEQQILVPKAPFFALVLSILATVYEPLQSAIQFPTGIARRILTGAWNLLFWTFLTPANHSSM